MQTATAKAISNASNGALPVNLLTGKKPQQLTAAQKAARAKALQAATGAPVPAAVQAHVAALLTTGNGAATQAAAQAALATLPVATGAAMQAAAAVLAGRALSLTWPLASTIKWLATGNNPTKPGAGRHVRVARIIAHHGQTLQAYVAAGGKLRSITYCVAKGWCAVVAPAA